MALPLNTPTALPPARGWIVPPVFAPLEFSPAYLATLDLIGRDSEMPGHSDVGVRNLLFTLILSVKPESVLEIGGHIGTATIVIGEALRINSFGLLYSLEPQQHYFDRLQFYIRQSENEERVHLLKGLSTDPEIVTRLLGVSPFELVFLDACHDYSAVKADLELCSRILAKDGIVVCHDTSIHAQSFDSTGKGGVRAAILEACGSSGVFESLFMEYPLWLNNCGAALLRKRKNTND